MLVLCYNGSREEVTPYYYHRPFYKNPKGSGAFAAEFAESVGTTRATIANAECGRVVPRQKLIQTVCEKYKINEVWLRTGEGEMHAALSHREEVAVLLGRFLAQKPDTLVHRLTEGLMVYEKPEELEAALSAILDFIKKTFPDALAPELPAPENNEEES